MSSEQDTIVRRPVGGLICPTEEFIRIATNADVESLFLFINKAYFEDYSKYQSEDFTTRLREVEEIHSLMEKGTFLLLTASYHEQMMVLNDGYSIVACVFINQLNICELMKQTIDAKLSVKIDLLAVHPTMVKRGIARYMMQVADAVAKHFRYTHVLLEVHSLQKHLLDIYAKWGFNIIGTKTLADSGINPKKYIIPCHIILMEKELL